MTGQVLDDLFAHAKDCPPNFRSKPERTRAERDAKTIQSIFDKFTAKDDAQTRLLLTAARLNSFAYNLDIGGAGERVVNYYERVLKREPNNREANYYYGRFLASASKPKEGVPYLVKALSWGRKAPVHTGVGVPKHG